MMELTKQYGEGPLPLKKIAEKHQLSEHYLEQLVTPLRNAGYVKSVRGAYGGYQLAKPPEEITAGDIICVLEGPISPVEFSREEHPARRDLWIRIRDAIVRELNSTTLASLIHFHEDKDNGNYMYYI